MDRIKVECYCGYRGDETPRRFWLGPRCITVAKVLDHWMAPDHRYFKILGEDGDIYILRHDARDAFWELTFFKSRSTPTLG